MRDERFQPVRSAILAIFGRRCSASRDVPSRAGAFERTEEHHTDDDAGTEEYELSSGARTAGFQFHVVLEMLICYGDVLNRT